MIVQIYCLASVLIFHNLRNASTYDGHVSLSEFKFDQTLQNAPINKSTSGSVNVKAHQLMPKKVSLCKVSAIGKFWCLNSEALFGERRLYGSGLLR
jgi:hypothetical protein